MQQEKALAKAQAGSGTPVDFSGTWENELASTMTITQSGAAISGTYQSAVGEGGDQTGTLSGYANGNLISFIVYWTNVQAITAWVGQFDTNTNSINTLWQMTQATDPGDEWASINAGADYFVRVGSR